jgi:hypothetical protein
MHLVRELRYDGPWLQLMPDSSADCEVLEALATAGVRTCGLDTVEEARRLHALLRDATGRPQARTGGAR